MTIARQRPRTVYFIKPVGMDGPIKIGCSASPDRRRSSLETWSPFALEIIAEIAGNLEIERRFHSFLRDSHQRREWFHCTPQVLAVVNAINAGEFDVASLPPAQPMSRPSDRPIRRWSEASKRRASYGHRLRSTVKRTHQRLPYDFEWSLADADSMAFVDAYLADPYANGISEIEWRREHVRQLRKTKSPWALSLIAAWAADDPELLELAA